MHDSVKLDPEQLVLINAHKKSEVIKFGLCKLNEKLIEHVQLINLNKNSFGLFFSSRHLIIIFIFLLYRMTTIRESISRSLVLLAKIAMAAQNREIPFNLRCD